MCVCVLFSQRSEPVDLRRRKRKRRLQHDPIGREPALPHPVRRRRRLPTAGAAAGGRAARRQRRIRAEVASHSVRSLRNEADDLSHGEGRRVISASGGRPWLAAQVCRRCSGSQTGRRIRRLGHRL